VEIIKPLCLLRCLIINEPKATEFTMEEGIVNELETWSYENRITFYILLRTQLRNQIGLFRKKITLEETFIKTVNQMISRVEILLQTQERITYDNSLKQIENYYITSGKYSKVIVPFLRKESVDAEILINNDRKEVKDAIDILNEYPNKLHVIIADPPYGFNVEHSTSDNCLSDLYCKFIDAAVNAIADRGYLIICLPAESYTGKILPHYTINKLVSSQILVKASKYGKFGYLPVSSLPAHEIFNPPFYWDSDKALRRSILYFRFYKTPQSKL